MKDEAAQPRNFKDRALVWISGLLAGGRVPLVPDSPRLLRVVDRHLFAMAPTQEETDRTFLAEDGSIWTFEFQFRDGEADIARMAGYHLSLARQYPKQAVHTVVFWGRRAPSRRRLQVQQVVFQPHQVFLRTTFAEEEVERLCQNIQERPLGREAALELAMLPLMRHTLGMRALLEKALPVVERLDADLREPTRAAMLCLGYGELHLPADREWARRELLNMPVVGQELFEDLVRDGEEKGRHEGELAGALRQAQKAVLEAFAARFDAVPTAVCDAVAQASDLERLSQWHRAVVRAQDAAAAAAAVLETH